ncbi:MAG TPA: hypothetical protein VL860_10840 [Planctomycetota bacterium]|nr:hypothetical protein [Planctomycetota bacterium]
MRNPRGLTARLALILAILAFAQPQHMSALDLWPPAPMPTAPGDKNAGPPSPFKLTLNTTLKLTALASHYPDDRFLYPQPDTALGLFRLRFDLKARYGELANFDLAYDHSAQWSSFDRGTTGFGGGGTGLGSGGSPGNSNHLPFRVTPLSDRLVDEDRVVWIHELDRLLFAWHPQWGELTVGRQAIGLGRGVLFSAVDLFAPFAPLAADREWRPGVDAIRAEARVNDTSSVEAMLVGDQTWAQSAGLLRARGYLGRADAELLAGIRREEPFAGAVASGAVGDAELHGELLLTRLKHPHPDGEPFHNDRLAAKAVAGASYNFNIGDGLSVVGEYFYNGLGATSPRRIARLLANPDFAERSRLGDLPTLTRHAIGLQAAYPFTSTVNGTLNVVFSPRDGSGILSPSTRWEVSESVTLSASGFLPWGARPDRGVIRSEYGASPYSLFAQLGWYL